MATPTYSDVISQINAYIVANGNNEITANVLNPILKIITDFTNNNIGNLEELTTSENNTVVEAINSIKIDFDNLVNNGVQLHTGFEDPNVTPPATYNYADFFMQLDSLDNSPMLLWQWNGFEWTSDDVVPTPEDIIGKISFGRILSPQQDFEIPIGKIAYIAYVNNAVWYPNDPSLASETNTFTQIDNVVSFKTIRPANNLIIIYYK